MFLYIIYIIYIYISYRYLSMIREFLNCVFATLWNPKVTAGRHGQCFGSKSQASVHSGAICFIFTFSFCSDRTLHLGFRTFAAMVSRAFRSSNDLPEASVSEDVIAPLQAPREQCTEIITRSYNPDRKFWQHVPKLPDEKPAKIPKEEIKIDIPGLRAKAIARLEKDKMSVTLKGLPATPQTSTPEARLDI